MQSNNQTKMPQIGLKELLYPISETDFLNSIWPEQALFIPATENKLKNIFELEQLQNLENLVNARVLKVRACLPDFDDEYSSIHLDPKDALKAYDNNMTLVFDSMQKQSSLIAETLKNLTSDLNLVFGSLENNLCQARSIAYATPAYCGTRLHFDANANFVIQIRGTKKWSLVKNNSVHFPTERFTTGSFEMSEALENQCHDQLLDSLPDEGVTEYLMTPGSVLFVPRGHWHETTTEEDSLSLNFTFSQPTWADVFSKSLHSVLLNSPEWRKLPLGLKLSDSEKMLQSFKALIQETAVETLLTPSGYLPQNSKQE